MFRIFKHKDKKTEAFDNVMSRASELHALNNVEGLFDLIKVIMLPIQAKHMSDAYFKKDHGGLESIRFFIDIGINFTSGGKNENSVEYSRLDDCKIDTQKYPKLIYLASDTVLPTSWHPSSIVNMLGQIGTEEKYKCGAFEQSINHMVLYTYPLDIVWVHGGNHSIAQGILRGEGVLKPKEIFDLTSMIELVKFDGLCWRAVDSNKNLGSPRYAEFGLAWEIGRLIISLQNSPYK